MRQEAFESAFAGLVEYNNKLAENYGNDVVCITPQFGTSQIISYPLSIFKEIRNVPLASFNNIRERVANVGYRLDVFAKDKGTKFTKLKVARDLAVWLDEFLTDTVGLTRVSYNENDLVEDGAICHIIMTYAGNFSETRLKFL